MVTELVTRNTVTFLAIIELYILSSITVGGWLLDLVQDDTVKLIYRRFLLQCEPLYALCGIRAASKTLVCH